MSQESIQTEHYIRHAYVVSASQLSGPGQSLNISGPLLLHLHNEHIEHTFLQGGLRMK